MVDDAKRSKNPMFQLKDFMIQPLDADGNPSGPPIIGGGEEKKRRRPKLFYIANRFVPKKDVDDKVVYFRIPTSIFAMNAEEGERIVDPTEVYVLHPDNLPFLRKTALIANLELEEWEWDKTILRPTIPPLYGNEGDEGKEEGRINYGHESVELDNHDDEHVDEGSYFSAMDLSNWDSDGDGVIRDVDIRPVKESKTEEEGMVEDVENAEVLLDKDVIGGRDWEESFEPRFLRLPEYSDYGFGEPLVDENKELDLDQNTTHEGEV